MKHGYLVEYQLVEEFEMVRSIIKESLGSYWFWVGTSYNEMNEYSVDTSYNEMNENRFTSLPIYIPNFQKFQF